MSTIDHAQTGRPARRRNLLAYIEMSATDTKGMQPDDIDRVRQEATDAARAELRAMGCDPDDYDFGDVGGPGRVVIRAVERKEDVPSLTEQVAALTNQNTELRDEIRAAQLIIVALVEQLGGEARVTRAAAVRSDAGRIVSERGVDGDLVLRLRVVKEG